MADELVVQKGDRPRIEAWFGTNVTALAAAAAAGALTIAVYDTAGYADGDTVLIDPGGQAPGATPDDPAPVAERRTIANSGVNAATGVITLTAALRFDHPRRTRVWEPADPTTVTLTVVDPAGRVRVLTGGSLTNAAVGSYSYDLDIDAVGTWRYRWAGTGALVAGGAEGSIRCEATI